MDRHVVETTRERFAELFGSSDGAHLFFSPGRVNLIGEHTDYNGGHVFPCAISLGTWAMVKSRGDKMLRVHSLNYDHMQPVIASVNSLEKQQQYAWANYPFGVVRMLEDAGHPLPHGLDILFFGSLPNGAGLSSSASIEVLMATICNEVFRFGLNRVKIAQISQRAENVFVGMPCGIMDQFAVSVGRRDHAILLDCETLKYEQTPLYLSGCHIVITNTNKPRELRESNEYAKRRAQCEEALGDINKVRPVKSLGELTEEEFEDLSEAIRDPECRKRARHAVTENQRTLQAVVALKRGDLREFGRLMNASHVSLRDDYAVTGAELDALAEAAWEIPGVFGSRMTGAGFGGCTVSLVERQSMPIFQQKVAAAYEKATQYTPSFYVAETSDGADVMPEF